MECSCRVPPPVKLRACCVTDNIGSTVITLVVGTRNNHMRVENFLKRAFSNWQRTKNYINFGATENAVYRG